MALGPHLCERVQLLIRARIPFAVDRDRCERRGATGWPNSGARISLGRGSGLAWREGAAAAAIGRGWSYGRRPRSRVCM